VPKMKPLPLAEPLDGQKLSKPSVRQRVLNWFQRRWIFAMALIGISPQPQIWTQNDIAPTEFAFKARKWWRLACAIPLPFAACVTLFFLGSRVLATTKAQDLDALLRAVLPAASLTAGFLAAALINAQADAKGLRRKRVDALRECQRELEPIRQAFDALLIDFNNRTAKGADLKRFLDCVCRVGGFTFGGSGPGGNLIDVKRIDDIVDALEQLSGTLSRPKHYRHLVEQLGGGPAEDITSLRGVIVARWQGVANAVAKVRPEAATDDNWKYLSFWEDLVEHALELATRTRRLAIRVHFEDVTRLRAMFAHLAWLVAVAVAAPLVGLGFIGNTEAKAGLAAVAIVGMLMILASSLILLYRWATQRLHDEG